MGFVSEGFERDVEYLKGLIIYKICLTWYLQGIIPIEWLCIFEKYEHLQLSVRWHQSEHGTISHRKKYQIAENE